MNSVPLELAKQAAITRAEWVNAVLVAGVLLSATVALVRYRGGTEFELLDIKFPLRLFPIFCVAYSVAHGYVAYLLVTLCRQIAPNTAVWQELTLNGPLILNGMLPRTVVRLRWLSITFYQIPLRDPTLWLFYSFCAAVYIGSRSSARLAGFTSRAATVFSAVVVVTNWIIGSWWAHAVGMLAGPR